MNKNFTISATLRHSWDAMKPNLLVLLGLQLGYLLLSSLISWIPMGMEPLSAMSILTYLFLAVFGVIFSMGFYKVCLQAVDGEEPTFSSFGEVISRIPIYLLVTLLYSIAVIIGLVLFIIPGYYLAFRLQYAIFFAIEGEGVKSSMQKSWELTQGNVGKIILLVLTMVGILVCGALLLLVGIFPAIVWIYLATAASYRLMQKDLAARQATAEPITAEEIQSDETY